jgi:sugar phosphate isomerase/epimerase
MKLGSVLPHFIPGTIFDRMKYAHHLGLDYLQIFLWQEVTDDYAGQVKQWAAELELELGLGIRTLDPYSTSRAHDPDRLVDYAKAMLHLAKLLGSSTLRTAIGSREDRNTEQPIEAHIEAMVKNIRAVRDLALDLNIKIVVENHAGDLTARELQGLVEAAGTDYVGVCLDNANPCWLAESPFTTLEILAPYILTAHIRDMSLWEHSRGAAWQLQPMGEGNINIKAWSEYFIAHCPEAPFVLEIITGRPPVIINFLEPEFWQDLPQARGSDLAQFVKLVKAGEPFMGAMLTTQSALRNGGDHILGYMEAIQLQNQLHLESSIKYCQDSLGLGEHKPQVELAKVETISPAAWQARLRGDA